MLLIAESFQLTCIQCEIDLSSTTRIHLQIYAPLFKIILLVIFLFQINVFKCMFFLYKATPLFVIIFHSIYEDK